MYRESKHVAQKQHSCHSCEKPIEVGTRYLRAVGLWDTGNGVYCLKHHLDCRALEAELNRLNGLQADEWMTLAEHVAEGGRGVLEGASQAIQARFPEEQDDEEDAIPGGRECHDGVSEAGRHG